MIQGFTKALEEGGEKLVDSLEENEKDLLKQMFEQITKLQEKNLQEFEKAINELVKLANKVIKSGEDRGNTELSNFGTKVKTDANENLFREKGINLKTKEDKQKQIDVETNKKLEQIESRVGKRNSLDKLTDLKTNEIETLKERGISPASKKDISYRKDGKPVSKEDILKELKDAQQLARKQADEEKEKVSKAGEEEKSTVKSDDTAYNRIKRSFAKPDQIDKVTGVAKIGGVGGLFKNVGGAIKDGFKQGIGFESDEDARNKIIEEQNNQPTSSNNSDGFMELKKLLEEILLSKKSEDLSPKKPEEQKFQPIDKLTDLTDDQIKTLEEQGIAPASEKDISYRKEGKPVSKDEINKTLAASSSEQQEQTAGISTDKTIVQMASIGAALTVLQDNSTDSLNIFKELLEKVDFLASWFETNGESLASGGGGGGAGGGGGMFDTVKKVAGGTGMGGVSMGALATGAAVTAGVAGVAYGAYKGYTGFQDAKKQEGAANKEIDEKISRGELSQAQGLEEKKKTKKTGRVEKSKAVGEGAGIAAGAAGGALLGATYGSALGPIGTAVGGVGGALVGGFVGGGGGKWLGEKAGQLSNWWNEDEDNGTKKKATANPTAKKGVVAGAMSGGAKIGSSMPQKTAAAEKKEDGMFSKLGSFAGDNKGKLLGAALGPLGMAAGALFDSTMKTGKTETGKNVDGSIIEAGTAATKDKMQVNVPPPTVINQGGSKGEGGGDKVQVPTTASSSRSDEGSWMRFQKTRALG
jgi:hypothetical protein